MLTRLYIDNFRCFEKFEWRPGRKQLILGRNGTGKTSLMDALHNLREVAARGERVDEWFKLSERTRWLDQREQVFEIEAQLKGVNYFYRLVIEPGGQPVRPRVQWETLRLNDDPIFDICNAEALNPGPSYQLDQSRSALSTFVGRGIAPFREWLAGISCWHINPFSLGSRAESESVEAGADFAPWYRHLVQAHPSENTAFLQDLRETLAGFDQLRLEHAGENVRILYAEFLRDGKSIRIPFGELSEGQRCLICLYAILHFVVAKGGTVVIDEPDNFISLREIQPWLMAVDDMVSDSKGQVLLISHHPEIMNQWAPAYGVQFVRDGVGPVRLEKFQGNPEYSLSPAELVARGWERD
jgi:predicted ATPase